MKHISVYQANKYLSDALIGQGVYVALAKKDGKEISGGDYRRVAITFHAPSEGQTANNAAVSFPMASADWGTVALVQLYDGASGGQLLLQAPAKVAQEVFVGNTYKIPENYLVVRFPGVL